MPSCFLILLRYFLRVDNVLFRVNDTRFYHEFGQPNLIREYVSREAPYSFIKSKLPKPAPWEPNKDVQDVSHLTDANWVASVLPPPKMVKKDKLFVGTYSKSQEKGDDKIDSGVLMVPSSSTISRSHAENAVQ